MGKTQEPMSVGVLRDPDGCFTNDGCTPDALFLLLSVGGFWNSPSQSCQWIQETFRL